MCGVVGGWVVGGSGRVWCDMCCSAIVLVLVSMGWLVVVYVAPL